MGNIGQLKGTMYITVIIALVIFVAFIAVVSLFISYAVGVELDPLSILFGGFVLAIIFMLIQFAISPYIVRATTHLRYLQPGENAWLEETVSKLAQQAGVKEPRLAIAPDQTPNAFVFGNSSSNMTLTVNQGLLSALSEDEIRGVIAHELGHVRHKDSIVMTFMSAIPLIAFLVVRMAFGIQVFGGVGGGRRGQRQGRAGLVVLAGIVGLIVYFISQLLVLRLSRLRESFADVFSAYLTTSPRSLESALTRITYGLSLSPQDPHGARALYISDPVLAKQEVAEVMQQKSKYDLDHDGVLDEHELELAMEAEAKSHWRTFNEAFATHPPTFKRILLLRQIDQEIQSRGTQSANIYSQI